MVLLTTTPQILSILSSLPPSAISTLTLTLPPSKDDTTNPRESSTPSDTATDPNADQTPTATTTLPLPTSTTSPISHRTLIALSHLRHKNATLNIPPLNTLLQGTHPYKPLPTPKPSKSPEYIALMSRLHADQEAREYAAMLTKRREHDTMTTGSEEDNISPSLVFNILLSVVMCAVAVFQVTKWYASDGVRVLLSLGAGVVVGVAEVGVYSIYLMKVARAKDKEKRVVERKVVIGEWVPPEEMDGAGTIVGEKEEIWGRGVNGGMRRRVREKWERENEKDGTE